MIKKTLFVVGGLALLGLFCFGRNATSYVGTTAGWVRDSVKDSVPIQFEIDRARNMVRELLPDIRKNMHVIAKEEVEVERLKKQIEGSEQKLDKDRNELMSLKSDAASGKDTFHYAGRTYSKQQVRIDLANRFGRYKTNEATLTSLRDILNAREQGLSAARQKLESMLAAKRQLEVEVENLEARLKMVEVAETSSNYNFDDSQLGRVRELVSDLRTRLQVSEKLAAVEGTLHEQIPVDAPATENIVDEVAEYFGDKSVKVAEVSNSK